MKPKDVLVVNLNVDWRVVMFLIIACGLIVVGYTRVFAQESAPINVNELPGQMPQAQPAANKRAEPLVECAEGLVPTVNGECISSQSAGVLPAAGVGAGSSINAPGSGRHFYLSNGNYNGNQPLIACDAGYHLASFWEIIDVTNLTYDYDHPLAHTKDDSGVGPPSYWYGWVRTGQASSGANMAGMGNCFNWTSSSGADYGVLVRLTNTWEYPGTEIVPWDATSFSCNTYGPVWCVGD